MKITSKKSFKKPLIITTAILVFVAAGAYGVYRLGLSDESQTTKAPEKASSVDLNKPTTDEKQTGTSIKSNSINGDSTTAKTPVNNDSSTTTKPNASLTITAANQNGDVLQIRTLIESVSISGTCTLTLTNGSDTITKTAGTQALASSSTCQGFDIPTSELTPGMWHIAIEFTSGSSTASATKDVKVQ